MEEEIKAEEMVNNNPEEMFGQLTEILLNTREQCQMVETLIHSQIEVKDGLINRLHDELEYYKQDSTDRFIEQLMKAVIKARNNMKKTIRSAKWEDMSVEDVKKEYEYALDDLTDLLEMQNINEFEAKEGDDFNSSRQQAVKSESTDNPELDKKIKASLSAGFMKGEKVLITERVVVYQYKEQ
ncbi:MAG: nucleotide exchange factor GrpE [Lachnospiraceae bacterium]